MSLIFFFSVISICISNSRYTRFGYRVRPDGNDYDFGHRVCEGDRELWDPPSTPLSRRNQIGRAIYQTSFKVKEATRHIRKGKSYDLSLHYSDDLPVFGQRYFNISLNCIDFQKNERVLNGFCQTNVNTNSIGNYGTQFDSLGHIFGYIPDRTDINKVTNKDIVFFNNFGGEVMFGNIDFREEPKTFPYLGPEKLPGFFTTAILLDIPASKGLDVLPDGYEIGTLDILDALHFAGLNEYYLNKGDAILVYTGWERYSKNKDIFYDTTRIPVITLEPFKDIFDKKGIMIYGTDSPTIEKEPYPLHYYWLVCKGGFFHEALVLKQWSDDARKGKVSYIGAYVFQPLPIKGAAGGAGRPMVYV